MRLLIVVVVFSTLAAATSAPPARAAELSPDTLSRAGLISRQTTGHYNHLGQEIYVGEPVTMGVVETLTLLTSDYEQRSVFWIGGCSSRGSALYRNAGGPC